MFNNHSDYALNKKHKDSIIYTGNDGSIIHIHCNDFSSPQEFLFWKSWSDENYRQIDNAESYYHRHNVSLYISDIQAFTPSPEEIMINRMDNENKNKITMHLINTLHNILSKKQFRRIWFYYGLGLKVRHIAKIEGVTHPKIVKSIQSAKKKISDCEIHGEPNQQYISDK